MKILAIALSALTLAACGGGGGGSTPAAAPPPATSAEGVYGGTLSGTSNSAFQMLVLENGDFWTLYGSSTASAFGVTGFVQGSATTNAINSTITAANAKDFGFSPAIAGTVSATYSATAKTINGTFTSTAGNATFNGGPIAGSLYNYSTPASLATVAGVWSTTALTGESISLNIAANGSFTAGGTSGCSFSGTVTPRSSGKNVFNVALTFGAAPCALSGQAASGIALTYPLTNGKTQLLISVIDGTRTYGAAAFGTR